VRASAKKKKGKKGSRVAGKGTGGEKRTSAHFRLPFTKKGGKKTLESEKTKGGEKKKSFHSWLHQSGKEREEKSQFLVWGEVEKKKGKKKYSVSSLVRVAGEKRSR